MLEAPSSECLTNRVAIMHFRGGALVNLEQYVLPWDWQVKSIKEVTLRAYQRDPGRQPNKTFRYVDVSSIDNTLFKIRSATEIKGSEAPSRARKDIRVDDVLFATVRPKLKRVALVPQSLDGEIASTGYCVLRSDSVKIEPSFLYNCLLTDWFIDSMGKLERGANYPAVRDSDVYRMKIPVPPIEEQKKIAAVLGTVQRAIEEQERLLQLTTELEKSLLHKLFTEGLRGEPQKMTEIGPVPESWEVVPLGENLTEAQYGLSTKGAEAEQYALLRMTNQQKGRIVPVNLQYVALTAGQFEKFRMQKQDILFNRTNSFDLVGRTAIFDLEGDFVFASYLIRLRTDSERLRPYFLNHYLNSDETQARLKSIATRAISQSNISATRLRGFLVPVPDPKEQDEIVAMINSIDQKVVFHDLKKRQLEDLFRTLLHQLMTAQVRVNELVLSEIEKADMSIEQKRPLINLKGDCNGGA